MSKSGRNGQGWVLEYIEVGFESRVRVRLVSRVVWDMGEGLVMIKM